MYAAAFDYTRAGTWEEAVARLGEAGEDARVIAGGQSLVAMMMLRLAQPSALIDLGGIEARAVEARDGTLMLSALTRHAELEHSDTVRAACPMLTEAARMIGNVRVRQRGTIGGSLAHGEATAELPCVAVAHRATVLALGPSGERAIAAEDLFETHLTTTLAPGEVITAVQFPALTRGQGSCFVELARRAGDFAMVEVAALVTLDDGGACTGARVVIGATGERPADHSAPALALHGAPVSEDAAGEVGRAIAEQAEVGPSTHAGPEYRRRMVGVLVKRALLTAAARANVGEQPPRSHSGPGIRPRRVPPPIGAGRNLPIELELNGRPLEARVTPNLSLLELLRTEAGATEVKLGCGEGVCGTCTVLLDGEPVNACLVLAVQADGGAVTTVRGLTDNGDLHPLQQRFLDHGGSQCGFCTPGMLLTSQWYLERHPDADREELRTALSGNLCRCTGYTKILDAVEAYRDGREAVAVVD